MKKTADIYSFLIVLTLALTGLASCRNPMQDSPDTPGTKGDTFMAVRIYDTEEGGQGTRTGENDTQHDSNYKDVGSKDYVFNKGLEAEKAIWSDFDLFETTPHFMFFFDEAGNILGDALRLSKYNPSNTNMDEDAEDYSSFTTLIASTKEDDPVLQFAKGKVLVVLNASKELSALLKSVSTYDTMLGLIRGPGSAYSDDYLYLDDNDTRYFTMSSSMIVKDDDKVEPANGGTIIWYKTENEALQNPSYEMYVERMQVKYTVIFKQGGKQYYFGTETDKDDYTYHPVNTNLVFTSTDDLVREAAGNLKLRYVTSYRRSESIGERQNLTVDVADWKVNVIGWGVNALERQEYLFKQLSAAGNYWKVGLDWKGGSYSDRRTFWAEDVNYGSGEYPDQYRTVDDGSSVKGLADVTPALDYFDFPTLAKKDTHQYSPENTFSTELFGGKLKEAYDSKAYLRVGTHVIVAAQLLIEGFDDADAYTSFDEKNGLSVGATDKYYMNGIYWTEEAYKNYVAEYLAYWMLEESNKKWYGSVDGNFYVQDGTEYRLATGADFRTESAFIKGGDGYVRVIPDKELYVKTVEDTYTKLGENGTHDYATLASDHPEYMAAHFSAGRMYYAIPVKHNLSAVSGNSITTGDYGAVRNHWYFFEINGIAAPGTAVDVPTQEIVPNNEPQEIGLGVDVRVLDWHKIETDVDVSGQPRPQPTN